MTSTYDAVVVGLGISGSAAAAALAARGASVLAVDAHGPTHRYGSSHGESRIFRRAYWEGTSYLPLLDRADRMWNELESAHGDVLTVRTGGLFMGDTTEGLVELSRSTARAGGIAHEIWDAAEANARFDWLSLGPDISVLHEPGAYTLLADRARLALIDAAVRAGAAVRFGERALAVPSTAEGATVRLASGETVSCGAVVLAAGPWSNDYLADELPGILRPHRVPVYWFRTRSSRGNEGMPAFVYESASGGVVYCCPEWGRGGREVKIGFHNRQQAPGDPSDPTPRPVGSTQQAEIAEAVSRFLTGIDPEPVRSAMCFYTMTPDGSFVIDRVRSAPRLVYSASCSGHGFKFAPAIGECLAQLALGEKPDIDLTAFARARFDVQDLSGK
ncbi:N-methyltryptophan oxidase [Streptomyces nojiriensis]|uniref:N-methyltryptophan oxidase n=1 Tax=Streptomyces nojiriensis TaxID=66374 RepID=A0ABQ3SLP6_9ACTN|nr:N-methyl-L-tryptophan oxidase [Streptomyces nojiriensis]QTI42558.1 Monomeric sarcosine oxidase [Streptomyces nojiriensis]GGS37864.1 N-methyltryptophan oxidase [Streptomyces nojiriensis]GHI68962.1 N-methyltryptophan oxidase [Streptomyces nojiriensis]